MEHVNITIGHHVFDRADYDADSDVLYLHAGEPSVGEGELTPEGHVVRFAPDTGRVVGLTVMGPRRLLARDGLLTITIPEIVETSAEELAPALAVR